MAQTGYTPIQLYVSTTPTNVPSAVNLADGEPAINIADMALYFKNSSGTVVRLINNPAGLRYPTADGTSGQVITTNGSGVLSWVTAGTGDVTLTGTQTLTNKTLTTPVLSATPSGTVAGRLGWDGLLTYGDGISVRVVVNTDGSQTLSNKTIEAGVFTNGYTEEVATANTSTAYTIDLANGSVQILTLTGNCTYTFPTATAGKSFMLLQKQDATGSRTVTWPSSVKWPSGTAPTITSTASKGDKFVFTADGTYWWGSVAGQNYL